MPFGLGHASEPRPAHNEQPFAGNTGLSQGKRRLGLASLIACGTLALVVIAYLGYGDNSQDIVQSASTSPSTSADPAPGKRHGIAEILEAQSQALLRGDEQGWLADVDPDSPRTVARFRELFSVLRRLGVTGWNPHLKEKPAPDRENPAVDAAGSGEISIGLAYCFARPTPCPEWDWFDADAEAPQVELELQYLLRDSRNFITDMWLSSADRVGQPPWLSGDLAVEEGERVIVGAAPGVTGRLAETVAAGDRAAAVVDKFAVGRRPPQRYVVYLATEKEWTTWFGGHEGKSTLGYAMPLGRTYQAVLHVDRWKASGMPLEELLRHELGHVVTLSDGVYGTAGGEQWLHEGIAEYIAHKGTPWSQTGHAPSVRRWIKKHGWNGPMSLPFYDSKKSSQEVTDIVYGGGELMFRCLVSTYGEAKAVKFFDVAERQDEGVRDASSKVFGKDWDAVDRGCAGYVRAA